MAVGFSDALNRRILGLGEAFARAAEAIDPTIDILRARFDLLRITASSIFQPFTDFEPGPGINELSASFNDLFNSAASADVSGLEASLERASAAIGTIAGEVRAIASASLPENFGQGIVESLNSVTATDAQEFGRTVATTIASFIPGVLSIPFNAQIFTDITNGLQNIFDGLDVQQFVTNVGNGLRGALEGVTELFTGLATPDDEGITASSVILGTISGTLGAIRDILDIALGGLSTGQLSALVLALTAFTQTGRAVAAPGRAAGQALIDPALQRAATRAETELRGLATALELLAGVDTRNVREYNQALAAQAEIQNRTAMLTRQINDLQARSNTLTAQEQQELNELIANRTRLTTQINAADASVRRHTASLQQQGVTALQAESQLRVVNNQLQAISNIRTDAVERSVGRIQGLISGLGGAGGAVGGAVGGAIGFEIGNNFVDIIESTLFDLPGWAEVGVTIATSFAAQAAGAAIGTAIGSLIATGIVTALGGAGAAALGGVFAAAIAAISLPALAIGAIVVGGVGLALYFADEIAAAWNSLTGFLSDFFGNIFAEAFGFGANEQAQAGAAATGEAAGQLNEVIDILQQTREDARGTTDFGRINATLASIEGILDREGFFSERQVETAVDRLNAALATMRFNEEQANTLRELLALIRSGSLNQFQTGGLVRGPGSGTSDSITARLSNGEYVIRASSVRRFGVDFFDRLNAGLFPGFAAGGLVGFQEGGQVNVPPDTDPGIAALITQINELTGFVATTMRIEEVSSSRLLLLAQELDTLEDLRTQLMDQTISDRDRFILQQRQNALTENVRNLLEDVEANTAGMGEGDGTGATNLGETQFGMDLSTNLSNDLARAFARGEFDSVGQVFRMGILRTIQDSVETQLASALGQIFNALFTQIVFDAQAAAQVASSISSGIGAFFGFQEGGLVPNAPGVGDRVPALLTPGELVVPRESFDDVVGDRGRTNQTVNINISGNVDQRSIDQIRRVIQGSPEQVGSANRLFTENTEGLRRV